MKAVVVTPLEAGSGRLIEMPRPEPHPGQVLVRVQRVGIDGTDQEILAGEYGQAPEGYDYLVMGHESLGRVEAVTDERGPLLPGDLVVGIVRRPDPDPCINCAAGEWDMCLNGKYLERGIKGLHGYLSEYYTEVPAFLIKLPEELSQVGVLLEPLTISEKGIEQIYRIQGRMAWQPRHALVLGAGPVGLLATAAFRLRGLEVHVYDTAEPGAKSALVEMMGATYYQARNMRPGHELSEDIGNIDVAFEATGYSPLAFAAMDMVGNNGIVCLSGVSGGSREQEVPTDHLNLEMVLGNKLVFGTVNANRRHFEAGMNDLQAANQRWPGLLEKMITRRVPMDLWSEGLRREPGDVKTVIEVAS